MNIFPIYLIYLFTSFPPGRLPVNPTQSPSGIYVFTYFSRPANTTKWTKMFPDDSIFFHNGYAFERITSSDDLFINNRIERSEKLKEYYFIDFYRKRFFSVKSLNEIKPAQKPAWEKLENKSLGVQFNFKYYNGEQYTRKDTCIEKQQYQLIRYPSMQENLHKGALITLYLQADSLSPVFSYNIENAFKRKVKLIAVNYPDNQGETKIELKYIKRNRNFYMFQLIQQTLDLLK